MHKNYKGIQGNIDKTLTAFGTVFNKYLLNERNRERKVGMKEGREGGKKEEILCPRYLVI